MTGTDPMLAWLRAQLDQDERMTKAAMRALDEWQAGNRPDQRWAVDADAPLGVYISGEWCCVGEGIAAFVAENSPEHWLAEVESKREILKLHSRAHECSTYEDHCSWILDSEVCDTVRLMLTPYRGRPGYDPDWSSRWTA